MKKTLIKKRVRDAFVIGIMTFTLLVACEVILRLIYPNKTHQLINPGYQFDEDYLVSLKPNIEKNFSRSAENGGNNIRWRTNKYSFRGENLEEDPDIRIIVYGDSNIQARFSNLRDTFPYKLEEYLERDLEKNIEVLNAGVISFGPD